jgi:uncharacterized protein YbbK (DUF523 family)/uncharacterized protein YbgA (DUF1722 family)
MESPPTPLPPRVLKPDGPIRLGISSCLLGERVRWDGDHKRDAFLAGTLSRYFTFVPVCPEVAIGLGVPRPPIRLVASGRIVRALGADGGGLDVTERLAAYGRSAAAELEQISGYVLKSDSPSCGMARVKVHGPGGRAPARRGVGIYARAFMAARPELPVEEEGRLSVAVLRESFLERVVALRRWQLLEELGLTRARLAAFHAAHRLSLMAHGSGASRALERLVTRPGRGPLRALAAGYVRGFMAALSRPPTRAGNARVLTRLAGQLAGALDRGDRAELAHLLMAYRAGRVPLSAPLTLISQHGRRHPHPSLDGQVYLDPHPAELMLRQGA